MHACHDTNGYFPSGGWGWFWVGEPGRGAGKRQPGGWVYSILPYAEQGPLADMTGLNGFTVRNQTSLSIFNCPSRRETRAYPSAFGYTYQNQPGVVLPTFGRTDYAGTSAGTVNSNEIDAGGATFADGDAAAAVLWDGIFGKKSETKIADITKGTSNQLMVGEKYLNPANYTTGTDPGDNECMYTGLNNDVYRTTFDPPMQDRMGVGNTLRFGSVHPGGINVVLADGSVRNVTYSVSQAVFREFGNIRSTVPFALN
jgi:prepilin-type processing-associated H-X9-DG protein